MDKGVQRPGAVHPSGRAPGTWFFTCEAECNTTMRQRCGGTKFGEQETHAMLYGFLDVVFALSCPVTALRVLQSAI